MTRKLFVYFCYLGSSSALATSGTSTLLKPFSSTAGGNSKLASYEEVKQEFEAQNKYETLDFKQAKKWFAKKGYAAEFETYFEARDFFAEKGYLKQINDGSGQYSFANNGQEADKNVFHDVMVAMFLSDFVYRIGNLRMNTKELGFSADELMQEVTIGESFLEENLSVDEKVMIKAYEEESKGKKKWDPRGPMTKLMQGTLKVGPKEIKTPNANMAQLEDVLRYERLESLRKKMANELTVTAIHSMKVNRVFMHKFDAKYNKKNLVYSIASRERKSGNEAKGGSNQHDLFLAFRGSVTSRDWLQNIQAPLVDLILRKDKISGKHFLVEQKTFKKIEIEPELHDELEKAIGDIPIRVHSGFLGYLFADRGMNDDGNPDDTDTMYDNIKMGLTRLLKHKSMETDTLYVTGHSLGGALATLASFFLACDRTINNNSVDWKGIKCVSFASPFVGNISFQRAFHVLQRKQGYQSSVSKNKGQRLFTNIRITNHRDLVPLLPCFSRYRHVAGVHVHLKRPSFFGLGKPRAADIQVEQPRWKSTFDIMAPWKIFPPTSLLSGIFATTRHFVGCIASTIPALYILPVVALHSLSLGLPIEKFQAFFMHWCGGGKFAQNALVTALAPFASNPAVRFSVLGLALLFFGAKKEASVVERSGLVLSGVSFYGHLFLYLLNKTKYKWLTLHWEVNLILGLLAAQFVCLYLRGSKEVWSFSTHGLQDYYAHLAPNHKLLSSSTAILNEAQKGGIEL